MPKRELVPVGGGGGNGGGGGPNLGGGSDAPVPPKSARPPAAPKPEFKPPRIVDTEAAVKKSAKIGENGAIGVNPEGGFIRFENGKSVEKGLTREWNELNKAEQKALQDAGHVDKNGNVVPSKKPYSDPNNRPKYAKNQAEEVWENAKQADGKVYDPNTGEELKWDRSKPRTDQWDMGHIPGEEYRKLHKDYMDGKITKEEFLRRYRDPKNYQPELPANNQGHKFEQK